MADNHKHHHHNEYLEGKKLLWVTLLNLGITIIQIIGGLVSNSLSLLSDAIHNLADSSAIFLAFIAGKISRKKPDDHKTYGYQRAEILAALLNGMILISICLLLFYEAFQRFVSPEPIKGKTVLIVASFGLIANLISVIVLKRDKDHNLNIKAAYLHLMGDTFSSVAVIAGGLIIWKFNIYWIDPVITVFVGIYIIYHTWDVIKQSIDILMQSTPGEIKLSEISESVKTIDHVDNMHHIHIWKLNDLQIHLEAHVNLDDNINMIKMMEVKRSIEDLLTTRFNISHTTLQMGYRCCKL